MKTPSVPTSESSAANRQRRKILGPRGSILIVVAGLTLFGLGVAFFGWSQGLVSDAQTRHSNAVIAAEELRIEQATTAARRAAEKVVRDQVAAEKKAKADADAAAFAAGFLPGSPNVYWKPDSSPCGYLNCSTVLVMVTQDCLKGVYVAASLMSGSTSIGLTNGITAGLPSGGSALLRMEFASQPDSVTVTDAHCLG